MRKVIILIVLLTHACVSDSVKKSKKSVVFAKTSNIEKEYKSPKSTMEFSFDNEVISLESNIISLVKKYDPLYQFDDLTRWKLIKQDSLIIWNTMYANYLFIDLSSERIIQTIASENDILILRLSQYDLLFQIIDEHGVSTIPLLDFIVDSTELFIEKPPEMREINEIDENNVIWTK
jgi:hypothetical protein